MIKTIVVDDEIWVIKLIRNIVNWDELGYCIVGDADNCEDALKLIKKSHNCCLPIYAYRAMTASILSVWQRKRYRI